ncbi:MAG: hypothetical protein ABR592_13930 [Nitriliruptorales bacterium]
MRRPTHTQLTVTGAAAAALLLAVPVLLLSGPEPSTNVAPIELSETTPDVPRPVSGNEVLPVQPPGAGTSPPLPEAAAPGPRPPDVVPLRPPAQEGALQVAPVSPASAPVKPSAQGGAVQVAPPPQPAGSDDDGPQTAGHPPPSVDRDDDGSQDDGADDSDDGSADD